MMSVCLFAMDKRLSIREEECVIRDIRLSLGLYILSIRDYGKWTRRKRKVTRSKESRIKDLG